MEENVLKHIIVDLEMNAISRSFDIKGSTHKEIIEIGAIMLDDDYKEIDSFKTYVKPQMNSEVEKRYESLTGITTEMVKDAPVFEEAIASFAKWCASYNDEFTLYQWSENDRTQIVSEMKLKNITPDENEERIVGGWVDFQKEFSHLLGLSKPIALDKAIDYAGEDFKGRQHDALYDARNTAELLALSRDEPKFEEKLKYVLEALRSDDHDATLGDMIDFSALLEQLD